ncbi:MAG: TolC family protein [Campylobacterales bacterium]|nr:TolC family protein [Campylobacterales bacterium]
MKTYSLLVLFIVFTSSVYSSDLSLLSSEKQSYYEQQQNQIDAGYEKLRTDWISPINLKASTLYEKSASMGMRDVRQNLSVGVAQDIFRSGGIEYAIGVAQAKKNADTIGMDKEIAGLNQQLISALLNYQKNALLLEQSEIRLKNTKIEIFLKRKQYEAGDIDITLLNNALMTQSGELKNNTAIRFALAQQRLEALKLTDRPINSLTLPTFTLTPKEEFVNEGWSVQYANALVQSTTQQYGQLKTSYLPKLTFIADAGVQRFEGQTSALNDYHGNFYDAGLQLSLPIAYNSSDTLQEAQAITLKQRASVADTKRQMEGIYEQSLSHIESYQRLITITNETLKFYGELITATKAAVNAGYKAGYDLQTLQNTRSIEELEIKINEVNIQIELATLYFLMRHSQKEPL